MRLERSQDLGQRLHRLRAILRLAIGPAIMQEDDRPRMHMRKHSLYDQPYPWSGPVMALCVPVDDGIALAADLVGGAAGGRQVPIGRTEEPQARIMGDALDDARR